MTRLKTLVFLATFSFSQIATLQAAGPLGNKPALQDDYPKAIFFRIGQNGFKKYEPWAERYGQLDGMSTKAGMEELPYLDWETLIQRMSRFATEKPDQLVLLHYNGRDRLLPTAGKRTPPSFPGHWTYRETTAPSQGISRSTTEIKIDDPQTFQEGLTNYNRTHTRDFPHPAIIVALNDDGSRNWEKTEYIAVHKLEGDTIDVTRGFLDSKARNFSSGKTQIALMCSRFGRDYGVYNFSTDCPKDPEGKTAADVFIEEFATWFAPDGIASALDGVHMDVVYFELHPQFDTDNDGIADGGIINGEYRYGAGMLALLKALRQTLGPDRIILADGHHSSNQRAAQWLNGMESEGIVTHKDSYKDIAKTINLFSYYTRHSHAPQVNFTLPKDNTVTDLAMEDRISRYGLAVTTVLGALTSHNILRVGRTQSEGLKNKPKPALIADELIAGKLGQKRWLGSPVGPMQLLGMETPNLIPDLDSERIAQTATAGPQTALSSTPSSFTFSSEKLPSMTLSSIPFASGDAIITFEARTSGSLYYGPEIPTRIHISTPNASHEHYEEPNRALAGPDDWQPIIAYFREIAPGELEFTISGDGPGWIAIRNLQLRNAPLGLLRHYEHGTVAANLSTRDLTISLEGKTLKRLQATDSQNTEVNNGEPVGDEITLKPISGIFLIEDNAR